MSKYNILEGILLREMENLDCTPGDACESCLNKERCDELTQAVFDELDFLEEVENGMLDNLETAINLLEEA
jgi:hypothetical protein